MKYRLLLNLFCGCTQYTVILRFVTKYIVPKTRGLANISSWDFKANHDDNDMNLFQYSDL